MSKIRNFDGEFGQQIRNIESKFRQNDFVLGLNVRFFGQHFGVDLSFSRMLWSTYRVSPQRTKHRRDFAKAEPNGVHYRYSSI